MVPFITTISIGSFEKNHTLLQFPGKMLTEAGENAKSLTWTREWMG